jgi:hypothetical protein
VQLPAGPGHAHTRSRAAHWITTAAALAAVMGTAALIQPSDAIATPGATPAPGGPDPAAAMYPLDCGPYEIIVTDHVAVDFDADGHAETVAAVRCDAAGGTPPNGLYVLAEPADPAAPPRLAETLVDPAERMTVGRLAADAGTVSARLFGYSSPDVSRSDPDLRRDVTWSWGDGRLTLDAEPAARSI